MIDLTQNEMQVMKLTLNYEDRESQLSDNMCNAGTVDVMQNTGWSKEKVGGVISSLEKKGLIEPDESKRGYAFIIWLTREGVNAYFDNFYKPFGNYINYINAKS